MIGDSIFMQRLNESIRRAARTRMNVLIIGETGTGKELVARAIHDLSPRANHRFVDVNCAALQENLFESEFFGHERGAFTGALERRIGKFELADKGSLFLDELGEMSMAMQAKLLRVLETREIERVGGRTKIPVDVRIIAATNRALKAAIAAGTFREDFYFRLQTKIIETTPLREHREDIPALVRHFLGQAQEEVDRVINRDFG
jgi:transcriptional regulator with PAS, ATPase and Fis domain